MVTRQNISRYDGVPPNDDAIIETRAIGGQLYSREEIEALVADPNSIMLWTGRCIREVRKLDLDLQGVADLVLQALRESIPRSAEWCEQNPDGPWAACDAYVLKRKEWNQAVQRDLECEYYLKFAISKTGKLLIASCHLSGT